MTNAYALAYLRYHGHGEIQYAPYLYGRAGQSTKLSPLGVWRRSDRRGAHILVDDSPDDDAGKNALGGAVRASGFARAEEQPWLTDAAATLPAEYVRLRSLYTRPDVLAQSRAWSLAWSGGTAVLSHELGGLDVGGHEALVLRAATGAGVTGGLTVKLVDAAGASAELSFAQGVGAAGLGPRWQDVILPLEPARQQGVDLGRLARLDLVATGSGQLLVDDVQFE